PVPARGAGVSLNESAGCGPAQGIRGPYATIAGDLPDTEAILGPWGSVYGRDFAEVRGHLQQVEMPMTGDQTVTVWIHSAVRPAFDAAIANLAQEQEFGNYYEIRSGDVSSFRPATVPPKRYLSFHAVGAAIDINTSANPYRDDNTLVTDMPDWFIRAWTDAGWCWGGDWQTIKDPMHFSWQGPLHTEGAPAAAPISVRTPPEAFLRALSIPTSLGPAPDGSHLLVADMDRDGAPDAVRLHPWTADGRLGIEIAQAIYGYQTGCTPLLTSPVDPGATFLMADGTAGGRPDLWEIDTGGVDVVVTIHTLDSGFSQRLRPRVTAIPSVPGSTFLAGDHDRDGATDLYVIGPETIEVWSGPEWVSLIARADRPAEVSEQSRFALADHDLDGVLDLFALDRGQPAALVVIPGSDDFGGSPLTIPTGVGDQAGAFSVHDIDGDGRPDLWFLDGEGGLTSYLGGDRGEATDADLMTWFVEGTDQPPTRQEACPTVPDGA
ncbi:MAG: M15 family metallopeptidase, partial [Acidimicrobiia bacterium]|nr:M15 family metallopeptidase [Acidimicrobiia bacterium]